MLSMGLYDINPTLPIAPAVSPERGYPVPLEEVIMEGYPEDPASCHHAAEDPSDCPSQLWSEGEEQTQVFTHTHIGETLCFDHC